MKKLFLQLFLFIFGIASAQLNCYLPNGNKCAADKVGNNAYELMGKFDKDRKFYTVYNQTTKASIVFKSLTKQPVFIDSFQNLTPDQITSSLNSVSFDHYFGDHNSGLLMDLDKHIKTKTITDLYVLNALGKSSKAGESNINGEKWMYLEYNDLSLKLWFKDSILIGYDRL